MRDIEAIGRTDKRPLYIQAISALAQMMESGELPIGSQLPPENQLAEMLAISRSTLREALSHLETYGMVIRKQGKGTFVSMPPGRGFLGGMERLEPFRKVAARAEKKHRVEERQVAQRTSFPEIARELELAEETEFTRVQVVESIDGVRCLYLDDYLLADGNEEEEIPDFQGSMLTYLAEKRTNPLAFSNTKVFAVNAGQQVAQLLDIDPDCPVLFLKEIYYDTAGSMLGLGYLYLVTEYFHYYVTRRVLPHY